MAALLLQGLPACGYPSTPALAACRSTNPPSAKACCCAKFNGILSDIAPMDADVITIETSRSDMELLRGLVYFQYPNQIGPCVYAIHSPPQGVARQCTAGVW